MSHIRCVLKHHLCSRNPNTAMIATDSTMITLTAYIISNVPRVVAMAVGAVAVFLVASIEGIGAGIISMTLTTLCISPLFVSSHDVDAESNSNREMSHIFEGTNPDELQQFRDEEHSLLGRLFHQTIELCNLEELAYVAYILRESRGLVILLICGIASMMTALLAGFESVDIFRAFLASVSCYGITTVLVARSARAIILDSNNAQSKQERLSYKEVKQIMSSIPQEIFVHEAETDNCDSERLAKMLQNRSKATEQQSTNDSKQKMIDKLQEERNFNDECCICLSGFQGGQIIRVLPKCHHEFHMCCIDKWALTFASKEYDCSPRMKRGRPTCPLCNRIFSEKEPRDLQITDC